MTAPVLQMCPRTDYHYAARWLQRLSVMLCASCQLVPASCAAQHQLQSSAELPSPGRTTKPRLQAWSPPDGNGGCSLTPAGWLLNRKHCPLAGIERRTLLAV